MAGVKPAQDAYSWLQGVQPGEVVTVIKTTKGSKREGTWATFEISSSQVTSVNQTHIRVAGQQFRKAHTAQGGWGYAVSGDRVRPCEEMDFWTLKARLHAAYNALCDLDTGLNKDTGVRNVLTALTQDTTDAEVTPVIVNALEAVVRKRLEMNELAQAITAEVKQAKKAFWAEATP